MEIKTRVEKAATVVTVKGRIDGVTAPQLENDLLELISRGVRRLIVNFEELDYISSAGLRTVLTVAKKLKSEQGSICFTGLKGAVEEVFKISGFYSLFKIYDSDASALSSI
ncbi:MAG: STAS domain-containing protein [Syntrophorhabdaceae bacterium]|nr:STAS domain-containing protein [Syntrophorhabdaceae bacterium]